jgi:cytidine deaminase
VSSAEYQREWRARQGAVTGRKGRPATQPCGTVAAYKRHRAHDEEPCGPCRAALAEYQRDLYRRRQTKAQAKAKAKPKAPR